MTIRLLGALRYTSIPRVTLVVFDNAATDNNAISLYRTNVTEFFSPKSRRFKTQEKHRRTQPFIRNKTRAKVFALSAEFTLRRFVDV